MGRWPSFHDAKVVSLLRSADSCTATIHLFEMTDELDRDRYFVLKKHHLVSITMRGIRSNSLPLPYNGDVLSELAIHPAGNLIEVNFESHMGQDGIVLCEAVYVTGVVPCEANGSVSDAQLSAPLAGLRPPVS